MSAVKERLVNVIEQLPEADLTLLFEIACRFVDDDIATDDDIAAHNIAMAEYAAGETISHNDINWD